MRTLVTGDLHLNDNPRDAYRHDFMRRLPEILLDNKIDQIVLLGDITDAKDNHSAWLVNQIVDHIDALRQNCLKVLILRGNHDYLDIANPFFRFVHHLQGVTFIHEPRAMGDDLFLPHTRNARDWNGLDFKCRWVFAHQTFAGAVGDNNEQLRGMPYDPRLDLCRRVICGDVHTPQKVGNVIYVGAPYHVDFGDHYPARMLILNDNKISEALVMGAQKRLVDLTWPNLGTHKINPGDVVKVRVSIMMKDVPQWNEIRRKILAHLGCEVYMIQPIVEYEKRTREQSKPIAKDDASLLKEYAKVRGLDKGTIQIGLGLLDGS